MNTNLSRTAWITLIALILTASCKSNSSPANKPSEVSKSNPASYIKYVDVLREGSDGLKVKMALADEAGNLTADVGSLQFDIAEKRDDMSGQSLRSWYEPLFSTTLPVSKEQFQKDASGNATWVSRRIAYSEFQTAPWLDSKGPYMLGGIGKLKVTFTSSGGKVLRGEREIGL